LCRKRPRGVNSGPKGAHRMYGLTTGMTSGRAFMLRLLLGRLLGERRDGRVTLKWAVMGSAADVGVRSGRDEVNRYIVHTVSIGSDRRRRKKSVHQFARTFTCAIDPVSHTREFEIKGAIQRLGG
jgi:hypothetical protein